VKGFRYSVAAITAVAFAAGLIGCVEKAPKRDQIPALKEALYRLQVAVKDKNRAAMDSLLSVRILSEKQSSDSLLRFVYNYNDRYFPFERFGNYSITYTQDRARIDCFVMDSSNGEERPIVLTFANEHHLWLLKRFEPGGKQSDSLQTP
jgi:hypothetical protein